MTPPSSNKEPGPELLASPEELKQAFKRIEAHAIATAEREVLIDEHTIVGASMWDVPLDDEGLDHPGARSATLSVYTRIEGTDGMEQESVVIYQYSGDYYFVAYNPRTPEPGLSWRKKVVRILEVLRQEQTSLVIEEPFEPTREEISMALLIREAFRRHLETETDKEIEDALDEKMREIGLSSLVYEETAETIKKAVLDDILSLIPEVA